jgi:hypothetical protein
MKILTLTLLVAFNSFCFAQEKKYNHCDCVETLTDSNYSIVSNGIEMETGQFLDKKRNGQWISKNHTGVIVRKANYSNGKLNGSYELFHYDGSRKLIAEFVDGLPAGDWTYYNEKGKIIKQGSYDSGKAIGTWKIFDKKGKQVYVEYNFQINSQVISPGTNQYFQKGGVIRDVQSGEWMILFLPYRKIKTASYPLGGHLLASDLFIAYFNVPTVYMNTYAHEEFQTKINLSGGVADITTVEHRERKDGFDISTHSFPFMVDTNSPSKLFRVEHSEASLQFLMDQIKEYVIISGPWIQNESDNEIVIQTPFVINEVRK